MQDVLQEGDGPGGVVNEVLCGIASGAIRCLGSGYAGAVAVCALS